MLVLSRKIGEEVVVGDCIRLMVVDIRVGKVKLAFSAPQDIPIHRKEVHDRIRAEQSRESSPALKAANSELRSPLGS